MIRNALLISLIVLTGCSVPADVDVQRSIDVATKQCESLNAELVSMRYLPVGDYRLSAICRTTSGAQFKIYPSPVYRR